MLNRNDQSKMQETIKLDYRCQLQYNALTEAQRFGILSLIGDEGRNANRSLLRFDWNELAVGTRVKIMLYACTYLKTKHTTHYGEEVNALLPHGAEYETCA